MLPTSVLFFFLSLGLLILGIRNAYGLSFELGRAGFFAFLTMAAICFLLSWITTSSTFQKELSQR